MQKVIQTTETMTKKQYCAFLTETVVPRDKMLRLFVILCTNIENQCGLEKLTVFKKEVGCVFVTLRESLDKYFPQADPSKKHFFITVLLSYMHGLYPLAYPSKKQVDAMALAGMEYVPVDFEDTFHKAMLLLLADW
jgi:hypothetical protein